MLKTCADGWLWRLTAEEGLGLLLSPLPFIAYDGARLFDIPKLGTCVAWVTGPLGSRCGEPAEPWPYTTPHGLMNLCAKHSGVATAECVPAHGEGWCYRHQERMEP